MVSAHFTERVLKDPNTNIIPARPKCMGFHPRAIFLSEATVITVMTIRYVRLWDLINSISTPNSP